MLVRIALCGPSHSFCSFSFFLSCPTVRSIQPLMMVSGL